MANYGTCRGCKVRMRWVVMPSGKGNPVDPAPVPDGNIVIDSEDPDGVEHGHVLTKKEIGELAAGMLPFGADEPPERFISHFATCPKRQQFGKQKAKKR